MRFTFSYPWILYLLWAVPLWAFLLYHLRQRRKRLLASFTGDTLAGKLLPKTKPHLEWIQISATFLAVTLLAIAAAGPRSTQRREQEVMVRGRDIVLLVDVSRSMLANDVQPSRLVRAKADVLDILDEMRPGDRFALVAFRNRATRITPFTSDQRFLRQAISALSIHSAPVGETDIEAAIRMAVDIFDDDSPAHKAAIMISDGEDLGGEAIRAAQDAGQKRIPFFTVGLGSRTGSTIPDPESPRGVLLHEGDPVITRLEAESLLTLARLTGGAYIPVETAGVGAVTLGQRIREHLRSVELQAYTTIEAGDHAELFPVFLLPAILLLLLAGSLSQGRLRAASQRLAVALLVLASVPQRSSAEEQPAPPQPEPIRQSHRAIARQAQEHQRAGAYEEATRLFMQAANQADTPRRSQDRYRYNAAIAAIQTGDHETAIALLDALPPMQQAELAKALSQFQRGKQAPDGSAEGYRSRVEQWQEAARLLQRYWQQTGTPEAEQDLQKLDNMLPLAEREANIAEILERYAEATPDKMAWQMLQEQRQQQDAVDAADLPPIGPEQLRYFEEQASKRKELADQYLALSHQLQAAGTPPENLKPLQQQQQNLAQQAEALRDLDPVAAPAAETGSPLYNTWRAIGSPESLLAESSRQQAWLQELANGTAAKRPPVSPANLQSEAATLTDLFGERFQPPPDTEPEVLEAINTLTDNAARLQRLAAEMLALDDQAGAREVQQEALDALQQLAKLLPQPPPSESDKQENDSEEPPPEPPTGEPDGEPNDDDEKLPPPPSDDPEDQNSDEEDLPPEPAEDETAEQDDATDDTFNLDALIEQVEQRAQEYRDRVQERQQRHRQPGTRDW